MNLWVFGAAKVDETMGIIQGRYSSGVAIMWRKELSKYIKIVDINVDWCMAIEVDMGSTKFVIFNIYMPYQAPENEDIYVEKLGWIKCYLEEIHCSNYAVIGDWNANLGITGTMTFKVPMIEFCRDNDLIISSHMLLPESTYTHIHTYEGNMHYSWLDHIVSSQDFHQSINNISVLYDMSDDDHIPVSFNICVDHLPTFSDNVNDITAKIKWDGITDINRNYYYTRSNEYFGKVTIPVSTLCCGNTACEEQSHRNELDTFYNEIVRAMQISSDHLVTNKANHFNKPGWSDYVSDLYKFSRETYRIWLENGKPRQGFVHNIYTQSKRRFKYALRFIKKHENDLRKEAIAKKLSDSNPKGMWNEVNSVNNNKVPLPTSIEDASGSDNFLKLWKSHFQNLYLTV